MVKWGIIGAGNIAGRFAASLKNVENAQLYAVSCRTLEKAEAFASKWGAEVAYGGFEKIAEDPEVDAVYVATPHQYHLEWIIECLSKGKAVLSEKPAVMNVDEMEQVIACARRNNVLFMEAMKTRFVPLYQEVRRRVNEGEIGSLKSLHVSLCNEMPANMPNTYHMDPASGGCLTDTGIYCLAWLQDYCRTDVNVVRAEERLVNGVNQYTEAELKAEKMDLYMDCAFDRRKPRQAILTGEKGTIIVEDLHRPTKAVLKNAEGEEVIEMPYEHDDFYGQLDHFTKLLELGEKESVVMSLNDSLQCAKMMDQIDEMAKGGTC